MRTILKNFPFLDCRRWCRVHNDFKQNWDNFRFAF